MHPVNAMSEPAKHVQCPVLVVRLCDAQLSGDTIADAVRDDLLSTYKHSGATHIVLDMSHVVYLASAGIRPLLALNREVKEREGRLLLSGLTRDVESVLVATRLVSSNKIAPAPFEKFPDVPSAVASLYQTGV